MYGLGGERDLTESILPNLTGYENAQPVRIGNGAYDQDQHDVWGALLDSVYLNAKSRDRMSERVWPIVVAQVEKAIERWREPDRGIWEVRGEPRHFTSSKMFCWVALDRGARLARRRGEDALEEKWRGVADEIHADICANGVDERGVFTQFYGTDALDASLLLMPLVRFLPRDDQRIRATVLAIADELTMDGLVLRYRVEQTDDGLSGEEDVHDLLVLVGLGARRDRRAPARACPLREAPVLRESSPALRRGDRRRHRAPPRKLPAGLHAPGAHQRRGPLDPGGDADAARLLDGAPDRHLMRALVAAPGAPGGIEPRDVDEPVPANGVAVVEVRACSLNRGECAALLIAEDGWRPGWDVAGVAEPALDGSTPPAGTRVTAWASGGGWAERVAVRSDHLAPIPDDLSFETASTLPVAGLTALGTLAFGGSLEGTSVAITGAAGWGRPICSPARASSRRQGDGRGRQPNAVEVSASSEPTTLSSASRR